MILEELWTREAAVSEQPCFADIACGLLKLMFLAREGDRRESILLHQGKGWFHLAGAGHEAIAALGYRLTEQDYLFPAYRDRALMHVRGVTLEHLARDFFARQGSSSEGRNLPSHFSSRKHNVFSITSPVGAQCLPAVGVAQGIRRAGTDAVVLCHIGEAATRQGEFYEAVCQAVQEQLPILFVVEDNGYGISTPTRRQTPRSLNIFAPEHITTLDGRDAEGVHAVGGEMIAQIRRGAGPGILWCDVDRLSSHTEADDQRIYRPALELEVMQLRDPIPLLADRLIAAGRLTAPDWETQQAQMVEYARAVYHEIEREPLPADAAITTHLYGPRITSPSPPAAPKTPQTTMLQAVNYILRAGLEADPRMLLFGEDIEDPKGGVFGLTRGLSVDFPDRVVNSPLAEATIVGTAVGLAATGFRPVFELQFIDFIGPAFNQLISQVSNLRWRTGGDWTCPLVLYAPCGAYLPAGGMWHSQSNEGWWAHLPGLRVAVPSTPQDARDLFWSAFHDEDPSLILLPKHLFHAPFATLETPSLPFGRARTVRSGSHATIVCWGNCVEIAEEAAERLLDSDIHVEILDLRTLVPCDWEAIAESLSRTGRLIVVQEDNRTGGFGQAIVSEMTSDPQRFYTLAAPPQLVARLDVPVPFCPKLERAILPDAQAIIAAVKITLE